ncbi:hypothetical protein [Streptomyces sp. MBT33]|uniref:hypothetical protein n=1 Tax=Streptomyces sp. MBT33 TaxID=1488363 RepID=UPI00190CACF1|nr:hypothetical protein [Streptomyces sp. MBT33]MBK3639523.1 hypothetical protein [Streptomyces sp. MBT33]
MSDPAPTLACSSCPAALEPAELISDGTCRTRLFYDRAILTLLVVNVILTVMFGVLGTVRHGSSTDPKPSPTATATPPPDDPGSSGGPTSGPEPTPTLSMPADPTDGGCNIFDPECSDPDGTTGGVET